MGIDFNSKCNIYPVKKIDETSGTLNSSLAVLLVCYNNFDTIAECLDSVLAQQVDFNFTIIIGDDFSTDGTRNILLTYQKKFPEKIILLFPKSNLLNPVKYQFSNSPIAYSFYNEALNYKYSAFIDGDDFWTKSNKLQKQVDLLESHPDCSICTHWVKTVDESGREIDGDAFVSKDFPQKMTSYDMFITNDSRSPKGTGYHPQSWMFRSHLLKNIPNWILKLRGVDDLMFVDFLNYGYCHCLQEYMGTYRIRKKSSWAPLHVRSKALAQTHFLFRVRNEYAIYRSRVDTLLKSHFAEWKDWPASGRDNHIIFIELFRTCRKDPRMAIQLIYFCCRVWIHQVVFSVISKAKINLGRMLKAACLK